MHKIIKDLETDVTLAFSESHAERVAGKTRSKYMTASKQVQNISPTSGRIHDTGDDLNPTLIGEAGGLGRGLDVRALGCVVGFIVHAVPVICWRAVRPEPRGVSERVFAP